MNWFRQKKAAFKDEHKVERLFRSTVFFKEKKGEFCQEALSHDNLESYFEHVHFGEAIRNT